LDIAVQIDTTPHRSETPITRGVPRLDPSFNRTAVGITKDEIAFIESMIRPMGEGGD
jgi:hypothetical protein